MPIFAYRAKRTPEVVDTGAIQADSRGVAVERLHAMGYSLLSLQEGGEGSPLSMQLSWRGLQRIRVNDLAMFWRQLASLLEAGLPLVKALETVEEQSENRKLAFVVSEVRRSVENAASLSQALSRFPRAFGPLYVSVVATGEATGTLAQVCERLAARVEKEQDLRSKVTSALVYPAFLCIVGTIVVTVLVMFVIPKFAILFESMGQELPLPTRILMGVSGFVHSYWWLAGSAALVVVAAAYQFTRQAAGRAALDSLKLHLPVLGGVIRKIEMAKFAHTLGTLCANGVHVLPALEITARTASNRVIAREVESAREKVEKGSRVEAALREGRHFPPALVNMVAVGEDSASLAEMLGRVAQVYERESDRVVATLTRLLESLLILFLGAVTGLIVAAILLPIFRASALVR